MKLTFSCIILFALKIGQARLHVDEALLQEIESLNYLDMELYEYAQQIFAQQHGRTTLKLSDTVKYPFSWHVCLLIVGCPFIVLLSSIPNKDGKSSD